MKWEVGFPDSLNKASFWAIREPCVEILVGKATTLDPFAPNTHSADPQSQFPIPHWVNLGNHFPETSVN
jgi:hypothetical protein